MPTPKTDQFWQDEISGYGRNEALKPAAIRSLFLRRISLGTLRPPKKAQKVPSAKTISRILAEFRSSPESEKRKYDWLYWPESFIDERLPWEASRAALELLGYCMDRSRATEHVEIDGSVFEVDALVKWTRPTVDQAEWFWRISLAMPGASVLDRFDIVVQLMAVLPDISKFKGLLRMMEASAAVERWKVPAPPPRTSFRSPTKEEIAKALSEGFTVTETTDKEGKQHGRQRQTKRR